MLTKDKERCQKLTKVATLARIYFELVTLKAMKPLRLYHYFLVHPIGLFVLA